ncbi:MAG: hypothetical protein HYZ89_08255 [Candidatus Omnitrophica bacterium]|nr:hypothetical protein [Candidatus Omnitrophota bacterium]
MMRLKISQRSLVRVFGFFSWLLVLLHVLRLFFKWEIAIEQRIVPLWISWVAIIVFGYLGYVAVGWKPFWPINFIVASVVGWWRAYWRSEAKDKLQYIMTVTLIATALIYYWGASLQHRSVYLDTRPYIQLTLNSPQWDNPMEGKVELTCSVSYRNTGKVPAVNIETEAYVSSDKDGESRGSKFYRRDVGAQSTVSSLGSNQEDWASSKVVLSAAMTKYYVDIVVSYEGVDRGEKYWSHLTKTFRMEDRNHMFVEEGASVDWDRGQSRRPPKPAASDFKAPTVQQ